MFAYLAYQPIVNKRREVVGYELLYRDGSQNAAHVTDNDKATRKVVAETVGLFGLNRQTDGFLAINFTRNLIMDNFVLNLEPEKVIVQIKTNVLFDDELEAKLRDLRERGYIIALKNYLGEQRLRPYLSLFDIIRVDFKATNSIFQREATRKNILPNTLFMAEKVEREQDFETALDLGYQLFQGYLFAKPTLLSKEIPPLIQTSYGKILRVLSHIAPDIRWENECAQLVKDDLMLSYLFPREVNALPPSSLPYAKGSKKFRAADMPFIIYRMGPLLLRRWVCLALMREHNVSNDPDLPRRAYARGLFMEALAESSALDIDAKNGGAFLCGAFSLLDRIMGAPLKYLLGETKIPLPVWDALLGNAENDYVTLLRFAARYEAQEPDLEPAEIRTSLDGMGIERAYRHCLADADAAIVNMDTPLP